MKKIYRSQFKVHSAQHAVHRSDAGLPNVVWRRYGEGGQALVTLLFFMVMSITITTAAVLVVLANSSVASINEQGLSAYYGAEAGAEEGILRLLRNPSYSGESFSTNNVNVTVSVNSNTILATGSAANAKRTIQVQTVYNNNALTVTSWKEM